MNCKSQVLSRPDEVKNTRFELNLKSVFRISLLLLLQSLARCGKKDVSNDLVLVEKVFILF